MLWRGHYAEEILLSTIVSLQKDARGNSCCSDNYRGIALTSAINKVVDWVILLKYKDNLRSSELQFAYKEGHSTTMCTLALKEVVNYYTSRKGRVYCALLDASKAFDRVRFDKLFEALIKRNIPSSIIRLLLNMGWLSLRYFLNSEWRPPGRGSVTCSVHVIYGYVVYSLRR